LWADRFDGSLEEIFELQDKVALSVAVVIESTLQAAEIKRSIDRPTSDLTAYDFYLRALRNCYAWDKECILAALDLLEGATDNALLLMGQHRQSFLQLGSVDPRSSAK